MTARSIALRLGAAGLLLATLRELSPPAEPALRLCGFYWMTGRPCPLCGLTRALCALAKGNVADALHFHALSPLMLAMLLGLCRRGPACNRLWRGGLAAFAIYGASRMVFPAL